MAYSYAVLGAGRQGVAAAYDLARFGAAERLHIFDISPDAAESAALRLNRLLGRPVARPAALDVADTEAVRAALGPVDGCISAVHYTFNLAVTRLAIAQRTHATDFGGNTDVVRQQLDLAGDARQAGMTVVPDCGMGPGLNVSLATYAMSLVDVPREVRIWDGGLPQDPVEPWKYVSTFALAGLTNEYDGSAVFLRGGRLTPVPCFSDVEEVEFPAPLGRLEAFVTSGGLSTAPWTFQGTLQRLENKTLRYPGHVAQFKAFRDLGLLATDPIDVGGTRVVPRDVFHALLAPQIVRPLVRDICAMRVSCKGEKDGREAEAVVELIDRYDEQTGFTAMQRLTGWHASIMLIAAVERRIPPGVMSVERALSGAAIVAEARRRGLRVTEKVLE